MIAAGFIINKVINRLSGIYPVSRLAGHWFLFKAFILTASGTFCLVSPGISQVGKKLVYEINIRTEIGPGIARQLGSGLNQAAASKADLVIIHLNTYGGLLDAADTIRTRLLNSSIPVVAFIDNNAASAGALISIACERIYMRGGASLGAATVVDINAEVLPDKYQSYMRSMMRSTAEKRGRDPRIAEAMVDPRITIPGVNDSGKVLTFTTAEAIKNGYCEGKAESMEELLKLEKIEDYELVTYVPDFIESIISFLLNPAISGILLLIMLGGVYFELQTPGIGFPLFAAIGAAILYFAPLYLEGLAANWEILLAVIGFGLLAVEIFILPGFGVAGIAGIGLLIVAFTFSMLGNEGFDFSGVSKDVILRSLAIVVISMFSSIIISYILASRLIKTNRFGRLVLKGTMNSSEGYVSSDSSLSLLIGKKGITLSFLRPSGKVSIEGNSYTANAENYFIESGKIIVVTRFDGINIWVAESDT